MVYYFRLPNNQLVYMGKDKYENEELLKFAWKEDIWFHVDDFSSAHVYLRMPTEDYDINQIQVEVLEWCSQITRNNSIKGCKEPQVDIVYTPIGNVKKTPDLDIGTVVFYDNKQLRFVKNVKNNKDQFKMLSKTKEECFPDLEKLKEDHELEKRLKEKHTKLEKKKEIQDIEKEKKMKLMEVQKARYDFDNRCKTDEDVEQRNVINDEDDFL